MYVKDGLFCSEYCGDSPGTNTKYEKWGTWETIGLGQRYLNMAVGKVMTGGNYFLIGAVITR